MIDGEAPRTLSHEENHHSQLSRVRRERRVDPMRSVATRESVDGLTQV